MYLSLVLIAGEADFTEVLKTLLQKEVSVIIEYAKTEDEVIEKVNQLEPDLILLQTKYNDTDGFEICKKIRLSTYITRPNIIMISKNDTETSTSKIDGLLSGADDYLSLSLSDEELSVRIYAHIRRHIEALSDQTTKLPGFNLIHTSLKRSLNLKAQCAFMSIGLNNFETYNDTYGHFAGSQLLKAFIAIVKANIQTEEIFGQIGTKDFSIIASHYRAEVLADIICKTFDQIVPKFYAPFEAKRGFTIITDEERASIKVPLVSVSIGIVSNAYRFIDNYKTAISIANDMKELVKYQIGSGWILDRPLLALEEKMEVKNRTKVILVIEFDAALAYLLTTTLEMQGYMVEATNNREDAIKFLDNNKPDLVLMDAAILGEDGWVICDYIRENKELVKTKIIMATVLHDKEKAFLAGADLYIPKPYDILALHKWINKLINDSTF